MTNKTYKFTSENVTPGHPDRTVDIIVETLISEILSKDPNSKVALEGLLGKGFFVLAGELTTEAYVNVDKVVRNTIENIGFDRAKYGLDAHSMSVLVALNEQSPEIAGGVFKSYETREKIGVDKYDLQGSGDQGLVFGYASAHNTSYQPVTHKLASLVAEKLYFIRKEGEGKGLLLPDGKTQVTVDFVDGKPVNIDTVLVSTQHEKKVSLKAVQDFVRTQVIKPVIEEYNAEHALPGYELTDSGNYLVNPAGAWSVGSSASDVGVTNRKIVADTTGAAGHSGGGGLAGKDFSKVDRSGVYASRYAAKNLVAAGVADQLEIQIAYAIGVARPVSIKVDTFGTEKISLNEIEKLVEDNFDFKPLAIKETLLPTPEAYKHTALFGHLGRNPHGLFPWEELNKVDVLKSQIV